MSTRYRSLIAGASELPGKLPPTFETRFEVAKRPLRGPVRASRARFTSCAFWDNLSECLSPLHAFATPEHGTQRLSPSRGESFGELTQFTILEIQTLGCLRAK